MTTPTLSPEHRDRLAALADLLDTVPGDRFDMKWFCVRSGSRVYRPDAAVDIRQECGTVGCALGWAPSLFPPTSDELSWAVYAERVFGLPYGDAFEWLFASDWATIDNTPRGAAARIRWLLSNGLPEDWREQMSGEEKLCYDTQPLEAS